MPVQFPLEPGKPLTTFRFDIISVQALEQAGGANPAYLAQSGKQVTALVLMVQYGMKHVDADPDMTERKAQKLIQRYLSAGGKAKPLMDSLVKALNECGAYGDPDDAETAQGDEDAETDPTSAAMTRT